MIRICRFILILILMGLVVTEGFALAGENAVLEIGNKNFDAGVVVEGARISHTFIMKNKGVKPLEILKVIPDCGCTMVKFDKTILPSDSGVLHATFDTVDEIGQQVKTIQIYSNDTINPVVSVEMSAHVLEAVKINPDRIFFSGLTGRDLEKKIRIFTPDNKVFDLAVEKNMLPWGVDCRLEGSGNSYFAVFKNRAPSPGTFRGRIILKTSLYQRPYITIPVFSRVYDPVEVLPLKLDFGRISQERLKNKNISLAETVRVTCHTQEGFKITLVEISSTAAFTTKTTRLKNIGSYKIRVNPESSGLSLGEFTADLIIHTNIKGFSVINIPVNIEII